MEAFLRQKAQGRNNSFKFTAGKEVAKELEKFYTNTLYYKSYRLLQDNPIWDG